MRWFTTRPEAFDLVFLNGWQRVSRPSVSVVTIVAAARHPVPFCLLSQDADFSRSAAGVWGGGLVKEAGEQCVADADLLLREAALRRLLALDRDGELVTGHVRLAAGSLGVSERTVWRWLSRARRTGSSGPEARERFAVDDVLRRRLAFWRGNVPAVHRELVEAAAAGGAPAPSMATLQRAVARDLSPGDRAGVASMCSCSVPWGSGIRRGRPTTSRPRSRWMWKAGWSSPG
jgi:hypothetical protein